MEYKIFPGYGGTLVLAHGSSHNEDSSLRLSLVITWDVFSGKTFLVFFFLLKSPSLQHDHFNETLDISK